MTDQIQISIDRNTYDRLQTLMVPPLNDANAVILALLCQDGRCEDERASRAAVGLGAAGQHFTMEQELDRSSQGIYDSGGNT
ncbi:MAG: hypothetical protein A2Z95_05645 [Gallionellales bacterium GWA2_60_18]|nr:MAG: hypothetical protein A2Z95_05645 [Gallionellales bacterium GWA2_60_18]